jgi:hypothetical protein
MEENKLLEIVNIYDSVIKNFKKRSDVSSGFGLAWKKSSEIKPKLENVPHGIGEGLGTTGFCVSASEALLYDKVFQTNLRYRGARAKLISIDIKEQYYGHCFNGSQNKWHTAILVEDSKFNFIIDITCRQFGNDFIEKDIWDFNTWQNTLRSPLCKHYITDFNNNPQKITPTISEDIFNNDLNNTLLKYNLKDVTNITEFEREKISDFLLNKIKPLNNNLLLNNISSIDYKYINDITKLLQNLPFNSIKEGYSVLAFDTKESAKNWIELFLSDNSKLPMYLLVSNTLKESCLLNNINFNELNSTNNLSVQKNKTYIIFEFSGLFGIDSSWFNNSSIILPFGIELYLKKENIFNSGKLFADETKQTNTIIIKIENMNLD